MPDASPQTPAAARPAGGAAPRTVAASTLTGPQKAAVLILGLDETVATGILKKMNPADLKRLVAEVEALNLAGPEQIDAVFLEFSELMQRPVLPGTGKEYMRRLAANAVGAETLDRLLAPPQQQMDPMQALRSARVSTLAELLADEHPQVAAVILSQLPRDQASKVLLALPADLQVDLLGRLGSLAEIPAAALATASEVLARSLDAAAIGGNERREFDGVSFAAAMLNEMAPTEADRLLGELANNEDDELAPKLREAMFTFEDLGRLDRRQMGSLMRDIPGDVLRMALKQASETLRELFLSAVSTRVAEQIRDDLAIMPPVRLSEVEGAQRQIVEIAMRLAGEGKITLPSSGGGEKLV
jgi:flagellar motor switch protein FliG